MRVCICGGGSLGHVCASVLSSNKEVTLNMLSGHPEAWHRMVTAIDSDGKKYVGKLNCVSNDPSKVCAGQDVILLCLPGYLIEKTLNAIKPYIGEASVGTVVSSTGFFFFAHDILGEPARLFGFQRVPYIARVKEYGKSALLLGYKSNLAVAVENIDSPMDFVQNLSRLFLTPTSLLDSFYEAALTNSNPILHTGRLYTMFHGRENHVFDHNILFYKEWTDEASQKLIEMDKEFFELLVFLKIHSIPTLLEYYDSFDAASLTRKISSIPAFQSIASPMKQVECGWVADYHSRYFTEDFPYGLRFIKQLAHLYCISTPVIDEVYDWGIDCCNQDVVV